MATTAEGRTSPCDECGSDVGSGHDSECSCAVWLIVQYVHEDCAVAPGVSWSDEWPAACDSECPACGQPVSASSWEDLGST